MDEWLQTNLSDVCSDGGLIQTGPFGSQLHASDYVDGGAVAVIMPKDLKDSRIDLSTIARITNEEANRLSRHRVKRGDIVYSRRGDIERHGRVGEVEEGFLCGTGCLLVRPGRGVDSLFLSYQLNSEPVRTWLRGHAVGATMLNLNTEILSSLPIRIPNRATQSAISSMLGSLDDKIASNWKLVTAADRLVRTCFDSMNIFGAYSENLVGDLVLVSPSTPSPPPGEVAFIEMSALPTKGPIINQLGRREKLGGTRFKNGDTLFARITPCLENGKTGFVSGLEDGETGCGSTEFIILRARPGYPQLFPYALSRNEYFRAEAERHMVGTSGRQRVSAQDLANIPARMPEAPEMDMFANIADRVQPLLEALRTENHTLAALRDALLPGLMDGTLTVRAAEDLVSDVL